MTDTTPNIITDEQGRPLHLYRAFYMGKQTDLRAATMYEAQSRASLLFGAGRRPWAVNTVLLQLADGSGIEHHPASL